MTHAKMGYSACSLSKNKETTPDAFFHLFIFSEDFFDETFCNKRLNRKQSLT